MRENVYYTKRHGVGADDHVYALRRSAIAYSTQDYPYQYVLGKWSRNNAVAKLSGKNAPCGRDIGANAYQATRVDYYHDWIIAKIKEMR